MLFFQKLNKVRKNNFKHTAAFNNYGITKLFRSYDEKRRVAIPFEDFPGRLDPAGFVGAGNYIMQYMIINDLTRDLDQFVNPDDLNGVIEVFEIRNSFANTSISNAYTYYRTNGSGTHLIGIDKPGSNTTTQFM